MMYKTAPGFGEKKGYANGKEIILKKRKNLLSGENTLMKEPRKYEKLNAIKMNLTTRENFTYELEALALALLLGKYKKSSKSFELVFEFSENS